MRYPRWQRTRQSHARLSTSDRSLRHWLRAGARMANASSSMALSAARLERSRQHTAYHADIIAQYAQPPVNARSKFTNASWRHSGKHDASAWQPLYPSSLAVRAPATPHHHGLASAHNRTLAAAAATHTPGSTQLRHGSREGTEQGSQRRRRGCCWCQCPAPSAPASAAGSAPWRACPAHHSGLLAIGTGTVANVAVGGEPPCCDHAGSRPCQ